MVACLDELLLHKRYRILYMEKFRTFDGLQLLVKLWFDSVKDVFVILPPDFSPNFTISQRAKVNNKSIYIDFILLGFTRDDFPILQFIYAGGRQ